MNNDTLVVTQRGSGLANASQALSLAIGALAVASLVCQHGFELGRRFGPLFTWVDFSLAFGFGVMLLIHFLTARNRRSAIHERRFELFILGGCTVLLLLAPALPDELFADVFPGLAYRSGFGTVSGAVQLFLLGNICIQLLRLIQGILWPAFGLKSFWRARLPR